MRNQNTRIPRIGLLGVAVAAASVLAGCSMGSGYSGAGPDESEPAAVYEVIDRAQIPGAGLVSGLTTSPGGDLLALSRPDPLTGDPGAMSAWHTAGGDQGADLQAEHLFEIEAGGGDYVDLAAGFPQIGWAWSVAGLEDEAGGLTGEVAVSTGDRFGVLSDGRVDPQSDAGEYIGFDPVAEGLGPVTGVCSFGVDSLTSEGSPYLSSQLDNPLMASSTSISDPVRVPAGDGISIIEGSDDEEEEGIDLTGRLETGGSGVLPGLTDLNCLNEDQFAALALGSQVSGGGHGQIALAVVNRDLAQVWLESGYESEGAAEHVSGYPVASVSGSGADRVDAVVIDLSSRSVLSTVHISGDGIPEDAQVSAIELDSDGEYGWVVLDGVDEVFRIRVAGVNGDTV